DVRRTSRRLARRDAQLLANRANAFGRPRDGGRTHAVGGAVDGAGQARDAVRYLDVDVVALELLLRAEGLLHVVLHVVVTLLHDLLLGLRNDLQLVLHAVDARDLLRILGGRGLRLGGGHHAEQGDGAVARVDVDVERRGPLVRQQPHLDRGGDP